jgi:hypothetical protein
MIANIASDDALILPHRANPAGLNFRERQGRIMRASAQVTAPVRSPDDRGCEHQTQQTEQEHMLAHVRARAKHPWALGQPLSECWKEIWHVEAAGRHAVQGRTSDME